MSTGHTQRFRNCDSEFIARRTDPDDLPVSVIPPDGDARRTAAHSPGCLRSIPYAGLIGEFETDPT